MAFVGAEKFSEFYITFYIYFPGCCIFIIILYRPSLVNLTGYTISFIYMHIVYIQIIPCTCVHVFVRVYLLSLCINTVFECLPGIKCWCPRAFVLDPYCEVVLHLFVWRRRGIGVWGKMEEEEEEEEDGLGERARQEDTERQRQREWERHRETETESDRKRMRNTKRDRQRKTKRKTENEREADSCQKRCCCMYA